jgi:hypothetical protein
VYSDAGAPWDLLLRHRQAVESYFSHIGLDVVVAEHDGLAFLRKHRPEDGEGVLDVPELTIRRELPYLASLLCVLLVEALYRFEASGGEQARLVLSRDAIRELIKPFLPTRTNEARQSDNVEAQINNLIRYGFLRKMRGDDEALEVTRLLKHKIDADRIQEVKDRLATHAGQTDE